MIFTDILSQMITLVLIVLGGFIASKTNIMGGDFDRRLSAFIIKFTCPCLIAASAMGDVMPQREMILPLLGAGFATYAYLFAVASFLPLLFVKDKDLRGMYSFMLMFSNVGFMGYPIVAAIYGGESVFYACILNIPNTVTVFIFGVYFIVGGAGRIKFDWSVLYCPAMVACYIAIAIVALNIQSIPSFISTPVKLIGNITIPGSMLLIGSSMAHMKRRQILGTPKTYIMTVLHLIVVPLGLFLLSDLVGMDRQISLINTMLIAMPVASFGTMFCLNYGKDETHIVQGTFVSTFLSIITIPLIASIINSL